MPYLTETMKNAADQNPLYGKGDPGVLNYRISRILIDWLGHNPRYADYDAAIGALECSKLELYRRSLGPYEDTAIERNGDVYPSWLLPQDLEPIPDKPVDPDKDSEGYDPMMVTAIQNLIKEEKRAK